MIFGYLTSQARIEGARTIEKINRGPWKGPVSDQASLLNQHVLAVRALATRAAHLARAAQLTEPRAVENALNVYSWRKN